MQYFHGNQGNLATKTDLLEQQLSALDHAREFWSEPQRSKAIRALLPKTRWRGYLRGRKQRPLKPLLLELKEQAVTRQLQTLNTLHSATHRGTKSVIGALG